MTSPPITAEIIAACRQGAGEAAQAWQRAFGQPTQVAFHEPTDFLTLLAQDAWNAPGLAVVLQQRQGAVVLLVADPSASLSAWFAGREAKDKNRLATLAQELGQILLPEALRPTSELTLGIENVQEALLRCQPAEAADVLPLTIRYDEKLLPALLLGVVDFKGLQVIPTVTEAAQTAAVNLLPQPPASGSVSRFAAPKYHDFEDGIRDLPAYTRSLLKVQVPVVASLATTRLPVARILEIGPGSIIQFDQSCEQPLTLAVGEHEFAVGEAVKVGEKFGLRITSMVMPAERFWAVRGRRA